MGKGSRTPSLTLYNISLLPSPLKEVKQPEFEVPYGKQEETNQETEILLVDSEEVIEEEQTFDYEQEDKEDDEDEEINSEDERLFELEELQEKTSRLFNCKRNGCTKRSSKKNKKEKIKVGRCIKHIQQTKEQKKKEQLEDHFSRHKRAEGTTNSSHTSSSRGGRDREQEELQRAMRESARLYASTYGLTENQFMDIQSRDLTPEDYELLLLLDKTVKPKTLSEQMIHDFPTSKVEFSGETCRVCLTEYEIGELIKTLPCGHHFHSNCIHTWLTSSSVNCPIDGLPVTK